MTLNETQLCFQHLITNQGILFDNLKFLTQKNKEVLFHNEIKGINIYDKSQRVHIYSNGYYQRLIECIKADLPTIYHFLGEELFNHFALHYINNYPSKSYSLVDLTSSFSEFLKLTQPNYNTLSEEDKIQYELPIELLKLEQLRNQVLIAKGLEGFNLNKKIDNNYEGYLKVNPSVKIEHSKFELLELFNDLSNGDEEFDLPYYNESTILIYRFNYRPKYLYLQNWQVDLIRDLPIKSIKWNQFNKIEQSFLIDLLQKEIIYKP